jgi:hypothetical protein
MTNCRVTYNTRDNPNALRYEVRYIHEEYGVKIYGSSATRGGAEILVAELELLGRKGIGIINLGEPE